MVDLFLSTFSFSVSRTIWERSRCYNHQSSQCSKHVDHSQQLWTSYGVGLMAPGDYYERIKELVTCWVPLPFVFKPWQTRLRLLALLMLYTNAAQDVLCSLHALQLLGFRVLRKQAILQSRGRLAMCSIMCSTETLASVNQKCSLRSNSSEPV